MEEVLALSGVDLSVEELPSLRACQEAASCGRAELLFLLRQSGIARFSNRRKIATAVEQLQARSLHPVGASTTAALSPCSPGAGVAELAVTAEPPKLSAAAGIATAQPPVNSSAPPVLDAQAQACATETLPVASQCKATVSEEVDAHAAAAALLLSSSDEYAEFRPLFPLGNGKFGVVWLLQHPDGRKLVDKRVTLDGLNAEQMADAHKEIDILRRLEHAFVVRYHHSYEDTVTDKNSGSASRTLHILMEYCDGGALDTRLADQKQLGRPFDPKMVRRWAWQLTEALAHIHARRVVHRDVKTANVLLCSTSLGESAKLGDVGIARLMSTQTNFAATAVGTPYYLSPELISGSGYDGKADVWALGILLYELLALQRPFKGDNLAMLAMAIARKSPEALPEWTPQDLHELAFRCMKKEKATRPTAMELLCSEPIASWAAREREIEANGAPIHGTDSTTDTQIAAPTPPSTPKTPDIPGVGTAGVSGLAVTSELPHPVSGSNGGLAATTGCLGGSSACAATTDHLFSGMPGVPEAVSDSSTLAVPRGLRHLYQSRGSTAADPMWQLVDALVGHEVVAMCAGAQAAAVLTLEGEVFTWKLPGSDCELGWAVNIRPVRLRTGVAPVTQLACGDEMMLMLCSDGAMYEWTARSKIPHPLDGLAAMGIRSLSCGSEHSMVCTMNGLIFGWGKNEEGQLGVGDLDHRDAPCAIALPDGEVAQAVTCAANSSFVLTQGGRALSCGANDLRQLGQWQASSRRLEAGGFGEQAQAVGKTEDEEADEFDTMIEEGNCEWLQYMAIPEQVDGLLILLTCAPAHGAALTSDGRVLTWGNAEGGRLGRKRANGTSHTAHSLPATVSLLGDQRVSAISAGGAHTVAVTESGALWMWGMLGSNARPTSLPVRALGEKLGDGFFLRSCAASASYTLAVAIPPIPFEEEE